MNLLSTAERARIISALVEGNSIRATSRMTSFSTNTVTKLLVDMGEACGAYHDAHVRGLKSKRVQCDGSRYRAHALDGRGFGRHPA